MKMSEKSYEKFKGVVDFITENANDNEVNFILEALGVIIGEMARKQKEMKKHAKN